MLRPPAGAVGRQKPSSEEETVQVAIKSIHASDVATAARFLLEARLLHALQPHPYIVQLLAMQEHVLPLMLVMEYCELGNLRDFLRGGKLPGLAGEQELALCDMARQVATAVQYLHARLCLHRDLAARNVLLTRRQADGVDASSQEPLSRCGLVLKLADVGSARVLQTEDDYYNVGTGVVVENDVHRNLCFVSRFPQSTSDEAVPVRWQCPLAIKSRVYTSKADVYSFGVLVYEMFSHGGTPYAQLAVGEVLAMVEAGHRLDRPSFTTPQGIVELIRECTQMNMVRRPAMSVVRQWLERAVRDPAQCGKFDVGVIAAAVGVRRNAWLHWDEPQTVAAMQSDDAAESVL